MHWITSSALMMVLFGSASGMAFTEETDATATHVMPPLTVIGSQENIQRSIHNLFDESYVAARHPAGARPGRPRTLLAGLELRF